MTFRINCPIAPCAILFLFALLIPACGGSGDIPMQRTYKVTGQVTLDGNPLAGATVALIPKDASRFQMKERPQGVTDADGKFTISTYESGDGAPEGDYGVAIAMNTLEADGEDDTNQNPRRRPKLRIPALYQNPEQSGLSATVARKSNELPPFQLVSTKK
jgi:hypothetical protein